MVLFAMVGYEFIVLNISEPWMRHSKEPCGELSAPIAFCSYQYAVDNIIEVI